MRNSLKSMTGMGLAQLSIEGFDFSVKVQSVNSRYLDVNIRMPSVYSMYEIDLRNLVRNRLSRGKVDIYFDIRDIREESVKTTLNESLIKAYISAVSSLPDDELIKKEVSANDVLTFHQALKLEPLELEDPDLFKQGLESVLQSALDQLIENRISEGKRLHDDMSSRLSVCIENVSEIEKHSDQIKLEMKQRIHDRIAELLETEDLDEGRLEQEAAYLLDRSDITEEIVRFKSHIERFSEITNEGKEAGKKLDFLMQEINREINTIGSKAKSVDINRIVVDVKSELEKIREQVQNIE